MWHVNFHILEGGIIGYSHTKVAGGSKTFKTSLLSKNGSLEYRLY